MAWLNSKVSIDFTVQVGRLENALGWYHSHPGYGCWLSGIDVSTQMLNQQFQEPWVAIVVSMYGSKLLCIADTAWFNIDFFKMIRALCVCLHNMITFSRWILSVQCQQER